MIISTELKKNIDVRCSIIIPVYNNANFTSHALKSLMKLPNNYEIIIIDNGSTDHTIDVIQSFVAEHTCDQPYLLYSKSDVNLGFGAANNIGYYQSRGEYVLFLNNDIKVTDRVDDWPEMLIDAAEDGSIVCAQGGLLDSKFEFVKEGKNLKQTDYWYMSGWCVCAHVDTFHCLSLRDVNRQIWNEKYFLYFEDVDLTWRAKNINVNIKEVDIPVTHIGRVTGKKYGMFIYYKKSKKIFQKEWKSKYKP